jgi:hypothetical protein
MKIRNDGGEENLASEDLLLWMLCKAAPDCGLRVQAMNFRYEFESQLSAIVQSMMILKAACAEISSSQLLKRLMRVILLVGNFVNTNARDHSDAAASGIQLSSLMHLKEIKSAVSKDVSFLGKQFFLSLGFPFFAF